MVEGEYQELARNVEGIPAYRMLGLCITAIAKGLCEIRIPISTKILNPFRKVDAKVYSMVSNAAAFVASSTVLKTGNYIELVNSQISILSDEAQNHLEVIAVVEETDDMQHINSKVSIVDETGKLVVTANFRYRRKMGI
jgi:acyl-coenzyme A thioesterase PaaI-like protein